MNIYDNVFDINYNCKMSGLTDELVVLSVLKYFNRNNKNVIVLINSLYEANMFFKKFKTYTDDVVLFPMDDFITSIALAVSPELKMTRLETLKSLTSKKIIITNLMGFLKFLPSIKENNSFSLEVGKSIIRSEFLDLLDKFGYKRDSIVTSTGEFAVRGFIVDIFLFGEYHPIRIEFFGDEVSSIRYFDESSQRSLDEINSVIINPVDEILSKENSSIIDYCNNPLVVCLNYQQINASYLKLQEDIIDYCESSNIKTKKFMYYLEELLNDSYCFLNTLETLKDGLNINAVSLSCFDGDFDLLKKDVINYINKGYKVFFCLSNDKQIDAINSLSIDNVNFINIKINNGFIYNNCVFIGEYDIYKNNDNIVKFHNNYRLGRKIKDYDQLEKGDYVVHASHGVGIYAGLITLEKNGIKKDYLQINYLGNDKIYVPVENIGNVYKYSSSDVGAPKINRLNSVSWVKTKRNMQKRIKDISDELIKLYAARNLISNEKYITYAEEDIFANEFEYIETADQLKAINEIDQDLKSTKPMDRLLCGDVGFGKTEVAFRAIFKAILNNKQVFYLCPTTILSKQQYENALRRFKNYPIEIALLNRFTSSKEKDYIISGLKSGKIDLVFGTHRLLSDDVKFNKLGLLIVDEEQRFGVTHKERIKQFKNDVNVLTLSATPIPRTLKMAMSGLRDLSVIDTAPVNRYPVQTYVLAENDMIIKDAIYKELSRNGQIFILYNNISKMESKYNFLQKLVPEARIVYAHGQMSKNDLETIMEDFIDYKYDILLCTTIIETGIDIPNANTLIVFDADYFGLSQLYQLRGRVGRSDKIAYAYLFYDNRKLLNDIAVKRLQAIKEFTELGSGYKIAMRDLAIRGAGDILGSEQAGFVDSVGISLYMKMIEDELKRQRGEEILEEEDKVPLLNVETHISDNYVSDDDLKIEIHQKINEVDSYDKLIDIKNELEDRFGKVNESLIIYMYEEWFEKLAVKYDIKRVTQNDRLISIELSENISSKIKGDKLFLEAYSINPKFQLKYFNKRIIISLPIRNLEKHFIYYLVELLNKI